MLYNMNIEKCINWCVTRDITMRALAYYKKEGPLEINHLFLHQLDTVDEIGERLLAGETQLLAQSVTHCLNPAHRQVE